ncbi:S9 family peptidase [Sphingomonas sp. MMS24-J13]|uniref:S9 family peptidase n=1 Tax=Sphingomonas sp. MMS24-J13 TaxID=3238686 RepID=UPI00384E903D
MLKILLFSVALGLSSMAVAAPDALETALSLPVAGDLVGAQDVVRFAWVENAAGVRNIWVADKGKPARKLTAYTQDDGVELYELAFSRDGTKLAYVHGGDAEFPDGKIPNAALATATPEQQLYVTTLDGSAPVLIGQGHAPVFAPTSDAVAFTRKNELWLWRTGGKAERIASLTGTIDRLQWSPDGSKLLFVEDRQDHSFIGLMDVNGTSLAYLGPDLGHSVEPIFSPDGTRIAFISYVDPPAAAAPDGGPYWSLRLADVSSRAVRTLWSAPAGTGGQFAATRSQNLFWGAGDTLVFPWERTGWLHPYAIDATKGGVPRDLTPGVFEVDSFLLTPDRRNLVYAANAIDLERRHVWQVALAGGAPRALSKGGGTETYPTFGGDTLVATATDVTRPAYPAVIDKNLVPLGDVPQATGFVTPETVLLKAEDGGEVHAQLFRPKGPGPHPALIFVHGGPRRQMLPGFHPSSYYSNSYILNQHFAAEGYTVLSVNYRSGTGYGLAFREAPGIARGGATEYRDVLAAGRWLAARSDVDPKRIGIWGGSWGGYLTALALARNSDLFAVGVDFHGVHTMLRNIENNVSPDAQAAARQLQWQSSPMGAIGTWRSPVLLIHGDDDHNVDFTQSLLLARELAARRIPHEELVFPNERHGFLRYADWLQSYRAADDFLAKTLKPPYK